ncbi:unnamed protein product [Cylicocyclus nassatus]|uniref:Aminoacyl-tRNA synthetase class Ia domain-containing protein n=1 Tax=Cylicocyclus nassatus TaxID=53992 RepID=A0AA36H0B0_CYLNA|nr:unnamed protein product [Cylicocyclus nassatus]
MTMLKLLPKLPVSEEPRVALGGISRLNIGDGKIIPVRKETLGPVPEEDRIGITQPDRLLLDAVKLRIRSLTRYPLLKQTSPSWFVADLMDIARKYFRDDDVITRDHDVPDTWFNLSLIPLVTAEWPSPDFNPFFDVMETGWDILGFCVENQVIISDYTQMDRALEKERRYFLDLCKQIKKAGRNVLLIQKSIVRSSQNCARHQDYKRESGGHRCQNDGHAYIRRANVSWSIVGGPKLG